MERTVVIHPNSNHESSNCCAATRMRGAIERWFRVVVLAAFAIVAAKVGGEKPDRGVGAGAGETNRVECVEDAVGESGGPAPPQPADNGGAPGVLVMPSGDSPRLPSGDSPRLPTGDSPQLPAEMSANGLRQTQTPSIAQLSILGAVPHSSPFHLISHAGTVLAYIWACLLGTPVRPSAAGRRSTA